MLRRLASDSVVYGLAIAITRFLQVLTGAGLHPPFPDQPTAHREAETAKAHRG